MTREKMLEECVTPNEEVFQMCDEHYRKGRADAIDELAELLIKKCWSKMGDLEYVSEEEIKETAEQLKNSK